MLLGHFAQKVKSLRSQKLMFTKQKQKPVEMRPFHTKPLSKSSHTPYSDRMRSAKMQFAKNESLRE